MGYLSVSVSTQVVGPWVWVTIVPDVDYSGTGDNTLSGFCEVGWGSGSEQIQITSSSAIYDYPIYVGFDQSYSCWTEITGSPNGILYTSSEDGGGTTESDTPPNLVAPNNNAIITSGSVTLQVNQSPQYVEFNVGIVGQSGSFYGGIFNSGNNYWEKVLNNLAPGNYFWKARQNETWTSSWSAERYFTVPAKGGYHMII